MNWKLSLSAEYSMDCSEMGTREFEERKVESYRVNEKWWCNVCTFENDVKTSQSNDTLELCEMCNSARVKKERNVDEQN